MRAETPQPDTQTPPGAETEGHLLGQDHVHSPELSAWGTPASASFCPVFYSGCTNQHFHKQHKSWAGILDVSSPPTKSRHSNCRFYWLYLPDISKSFPPIWPSCSFPGSSSHYLFPGWSPSLMTCWPVISIGQIHFLRWPGWSLRIANFMPPLTCPTVYRSLELLMNFNSFILF